LLPWNWQLTKDVCDASRCSGILIIDGKYVRVQGFEKKIPFVYCIDYLTHDILHSELFLAEDEASFSIFFEKLYDLNYRLRIVVADDRAGIKQALLKVFPYARLQLCHNHYLENIRTDLNFRSSDRYHHFFNSLIKHVFEVSEDKITEGLMHVFHNRTEDKRLLQNIVTTIKVRQEDLFNYFKVKDSPKTTNIIESYNSHFQARLKSIRSFQSFESAKRWLNAYIIRRRAKKFTDCKGKFKHLNKHSSLELTIKKQAHWPDVLKTLGINKVNYYENFPEKTD
jgi:transposase-like protein